MADQLGAWSGEEAVLAAAEVTGRGGDSDLPDEQRFPREVAQHRHAQAVARFQRRVVVDEHALEVRRARGGQGRERLVAEVAVVPLVEQQRHTPASVAVAGAA